MATEPIRFSKATLLKMLDGRAARIAKEQEIEMNANEFKAQERAKNEAKFGRWASTRRAAAADPIKLLFEQAPRNELEAAQHGNALANTGNYPVGTSECFNVGISGGCGPDCFVYLKGECGEPQEMLPGMDADGLKLHAELYGPNAGDKPPQVGLD